MLTKVSLQANIIDISMYVYNIETLIKSGGGNGPMKPSNLL